MRKFSFRSKQRLRYLGIGAAVSLGVLVVAAICLVVYLQRFVVYTPDGAHLDFSQRPGSGSGTPGNPGFDVEPGLTPLPSAPIEREDPNAEETPAVTRLTGYYVTVEMLADPGAVLQAVTQESGPAAVLLDVRSIYGNYYYPSGLVGAETSSLVDAQAVAQLIADLAQRPNLHLAARLPAFRDSAYAVANQACGLPISGGALWLDEDNCYWLDPSDTQTLSHIEQAVQELAGLGFDEVVLDDFAFPQSGSIVFDGDRTEAILDAAKRLTANLGDTHVTLSVTSPTPALAAYLRRVYISGADGSQVQDLTKTLEADFTPLEDRLVFCTDSRDTRFAQYGLLRPAVSVGEGGD
ncbi:MAG: hypothetical protein HFF17_09765 [Oscillospiraceae bacterium]|nr:hypothetical protein [Oscillospiraceae bacterium]